MVSDDMLSLMALRYGASSGHMTLESFISLILRLDCMHSKWRRVRRMTSSASTRVIYDYFAWGETICSQFVLLNRNLQRVVWWKILESPGVRGNKTYSDSTFHTPQDRGTSFMVAFNVIVAAAVYILAIALEELHELIITMFLTHCKCSTNIRNQGNLRNYITI